MRAPTPIIEISPPRKNPPLETPSRCSSCPRPSRITWQMQIWCRAVSMLWCSLCVADLIMGMEELELHHRCRGRSNFRKIRIATISARKSKGGLSKGGLGPKGANWAQKGPFGAISALPPRLWGADELVPIGPEKAPIGPEKVPICPEKARFRRKDFPPIFSENLGLKPPFVSLPLDFPKFLLGW